MKKPTMLQKKSIITVVHSVQYQPRRLSMMKEPAIGAGDGADEGCRCERRDGDATASGIQEVCQRAANEGERRKPNTPPRQLHRKTVCRLCATGTGIWKIAKMK